MTLRVLWTLALLFHLGLAPRTASARVSMNAGETSSPAAQALENPHQGPWLGSPETRIGGPAQNRASRGGASATVTQTIIEGYGSGERELAAEQAFALFNFEVNGDHSFFVGKNGVLVHNANCGMAPWRRTEVDAQIGAALRRGETVIGAQYSQGGAMIGFDFASVKGVGKNAQLFINEVKDYTSRMPSLTDFTVFGFGKRGPPHFAQNIERLRERLAQSAAIDDVTRAAVLKQLDSRQARIRLIGGRNTVFDRYTLWSISRRTGFRTMRGLGL